MCISNEGYFLIIRRRNPFLIFLTSKNHDFTEKLIFPYSLYQKNIMNTAQFYYNLFKTVLIFLFVPELIFETQKKTFKTKKREYTFM